MNCVFLGPPGAGKGTVASKISKELSIPHISTGDMFRNAIKDQTPLGLKIKEVLDSGALVSDELTVDLVRQTLSKDKSSSGFILDGFPRTIPQAEALQDFGKLSIVVNFDISDEEVVRRLSGRRTCPSCGAIFHIEFMPPKTDNLCDNCGTALSVRKDDEVDAIKERLRVYNRQTKPLINFYRDSGLLRTIDASKSPEAVVEETLTLFR